MRHDDTTLEAMRVPAGRRRSRLAVAALAAATLIAPGLGARDSGAPASSRQDVRPPVSRGPASLALPGSAQAQLRVVAERHYTLNARIRLLFFWIGKDNVGSGRIKWAQGPDGARGYELLIGSDPDRAPRRINRWGYVAESLFGGRAELLGVMTEAGEASAEEAEAHVMRDPGGRYPFKAIRASVADGEARATVLYLTLAQNLTYRDVGQVLDRLPPRGQGEKRLRMPAGTDTGFLVAVARLISDSVADCARLGHPPAGLRRSYVYDRGFYDLALTSARTLRDVRLGGREYKSAAESKFEVTNRATGERTRFQITYETSGPLSGVPLRIVYRPRGWFEAELVLDASGA